MSSHNQQIRFCTGKDGTRIAYAVCGQGTPLVMAGHSFSHLESEWDCLVRRPLLELLSQRHTLIRYDMRGTGLSDRDCKEFSFARYIEDFEAVVAASRLSKFGLMGMTGGGALAVTYAARFPKQVSHMVLIGAYLRGRLIRSVTPAEREETELLLKLVELGWGQDNPTFRQLFTYQFLPDGTPAQLQSFDELMFKAASATNAALQLRAWFSADLRDTAPQVLCPTLVLHARGDLRVPFEEGRLLAASIPGARFVPLDSRNHLVLPEEPAWQKIIAELASFDRPAAQKALEPIDELTAREHAVLQVLVQGLDTPVMAERLCMSEKTVRNHLSSIYGKLGVANRVQAVGWVQAHKEKLDAIAAAGKTAAAGSKDWIPPWERER
jgi:pimeloyl-ACP methyl ester carboxylesterase/DNA-binding CsgD family transcriptional regulator